MADIREQLLAAFASEHREHQTHIREAFARARQGEPIDVREVFRRAHSLKGAARAVDLPKVEAAAHALEALFAPALESGQQLSGEHIGAALLKLDEIERAVNPPRAQSSESDEQRAPEASTFVRVDAERVARLSATVHEISAEIDAGAHHGEAAEELAREAQSLSRALEEALQNPARAAQSLTRLAPLARALARRASGAARAQAERSWSVERLSAQLRDEVARVAMVSADTVFSGLGPMLKDMGSEQGIEAELHVSGLNTEADRALLQSLRDPVIQLLRNALAHGAESASERRRRGKPDALQVFLSLSARAGRLRIIVADDGRGPDWKAIEATARKRGLIAGGEAEVSEDALASFVFEPGFSTAEHVEALAGRGMGLSVVAEAVRRAGGGAHMRARHPQGTEFILSTPLSAARQSLLLLEDGGVRFGLPAYAVERVIQNKADNFALVGGRRTLAFNEEGNQILVPIIPLNRVTGLDAGRERASGDETVTVAVLRQGDTRLGLLAARAEDVREATLINFEAGHVPQLNLAATQLEDGQSAPVLDPEIIFQRFLRHDLDLSADASQTKITERARKRVILVVDDSVTTRTLEKSILEAQGYKVVLAVDGLDALEALKRDAGEIDLIVADIEMPRLDGFGLLQSVKRDASLSRLPVIMMTSRAEQSDVERGLELGADAYLVKQSFDQRELLATIRQLL
jgi:two-component system, chemotaxis family, sensor kinase CheA